MFFKIKNIYVPDYLSSWWLHCCHFTAYQHAPVHLCLEVSPTYYICMKPPTYREVRFRRSACNFERLVLASPVLSCLRRSTSKGSSAPVQDAAAYNLGVHNSRRASVIQACRTIAEAPVPRKRATLSKYKFQRSTVQARSASWVGNVSIQGAECHLGPSPPAVPRSRLYECPMLCATSLPITPIPPKLNTACHHHLSPTPSCSLLFQRTGRK